MPPNHVPLYRQLATTLRYRIASGALRPGDRLPALREAGKRWRVSLHTVRRAYQVLVTEGLIQVVPGGTTQVAGPTAVHDALGPDASMREFVRWVHAESVRRFGGDGARVLSQLERAFQGSLPARYVVVECTATMARRLADQLSNALGEPVEWCMLAQLGLRTEPVVVSTYHHHQEVQDLARQRGAETRFLTSGVSPDWVSRVADVAASAKRLIITGPEAASLRAMAMELRRALGGRVAVESRLSPAPATVIREAGGVPVVCTPEAWELLPSGAGDRGPVMLHESEFSAEAIASLLR